MTQPDRFPSRGSKRLRAPIWLVVVLLVLVALNLYTVLGTAAIAADYQDLAIPFAPWVRFTYGLIWTLSFVALALGLIRGTSLAFRLVAPALTVFGAANLGWILVFGRADYPQGQIPFQMVLTAAALIPPWWLALRYGWLKRRQSGTD